MPIRFGFIVFVLALVGCDGTAPNEVPRDVPSDFTAIDEGIPEAIHVDRTPPHAIEVVTDGARQSLEVVEAHPLAGRRGAWDFRLRRLDGSVVDATLRYDGEAGRGQWSIPGVAVGAYSTR
ncbi:MAG: hypothetical protein KC619_32475 [Myxococcales bacterium]|nr:hypothetical protein [Myxococcales bacterium]